MNFVEDIELSDLDPLRLLSHDTLFDRRRHQEEHEERENASESLPEVDPHLVALLFRSMVKPLATHPSPTLFGFFPNPQSETSLKNLVQLLNRPDMQNLLEKTLKNLDNADIREQLKARSIRKNLRFLNLAIQRENQIWWRKNPLFSRIFWQIEKVRIP